jgi:hypothetical protein
VGMVAAAVWVTQSRAPLPTLIEHENEVKVERVSELLDMWVDAPVSKYQSEELAAAEWRCRRSLEQRKAQSCPRE